MKVTAENENSVRPQTAETEREYTTPGVNIFETKDGYVLEAEMPGVNKEGLNISLEENVLTIVGHRQAAPEAGLLYRESRPADFRRVFELAPSIEASGITAKIEQGILVLTLPKAEKVKPRKITVS
jgi:HSP20 family protein